MTHAPLMLNDQAMVLLCQYVHLEEAETARIAYHKEANPRYNSGDAFYNLMSSGRFAREVIDELVLVIQVLRLHRDLVSIRYLDWHFVLNEEMVEQASLLFTLRRDRPDVIRRHTSFFVYEVAQRYKRTVAERAFS